MIQNQDLNLIPTATPQPNTCFASSQDAWVSGATTVATIATLAYALKHYAPKSNDSQEPPKKFTNENITASFVAAIPSITRELNLEVATATQTETFTRSSSRATFWGLVDLGTNVVQVRVPVTYRYHIGLREPWELKVEGDKVLVTAPLLRASLPPAIHTDQMERLSVRGWARGSPRKLLQQMEREITPKLSEHAGAQQQLEHVRHACRLSVAEFVRLWLEREGQWQEGGLTAIQVRFADETSLPKDPTLKFIA